MPLFLEITSNPQVAKTKRNTNFVPEIISQETVEKRKPSGEKRLRNGFLFLEIEINGKEQQRNTLQQQK